MENPFVIGDDDGFMVNPFVIGDDDGFPLEDGDAAVAPTMEKARMIARKTAARNPGKPVYIFQAVEVCTATVNAPSFTKLLTLTPDPITPS